MIDADSFFAQYLSPKKKLSSLALTSAQIKLSPQRIYERETKTFLKPGQSHSVQSIHSSSKLLDLRETQRVEPQDLLALEHKIKEQSREIGAKEKLIERLQQQLSMQQDTLIYQQTKLEQMENSQVELGKLRAQYEERLEESQTLVLQLQQQLHNQGIELSQHHDQLMNTTRQALNSALAKAQELQSSNAALLESHRLEVESLNRQYHDSLNTMRQQLRSEASEKINHLEQEILVESLEHRLRAAEKELAVKEVRASRLLEDSEDHRSRLNTELEGARHAFERARHTITDQRAQLDRMEEQLTTMTQAQSLERSQHENEKRTLQIEIGRLQRQEETTRQRVEQLEQEVNRLLGKCSQQQNELQEALMREQQKNTEYEQSMKMIMSYQQINESLTQSEAQSKIRLQELEEYALQLREDTELECKDAHTKCSSLETQVNSLQSLNHQLQRLQQETHSQSTQLERDLSVQQALVDALKTQVGELNTQVNDLQARKTECEQQLEYQRQTSLVSRKQVEQKSQLEAVKWECKLQELTLANQNECKRYEMQIVLLQGQLSMQQNQMLEAQGAQCQALKVSLSEKERRVLEVTEALETADQRIREIELQMKAGTAQLQSSIEKLELSNHEVRCSNQDLQKKSHDLQSQIALLYEEKSQLQNGVRERDQLIETERIKYQLEQRAHLDAQRSRLSQEYESRVQAQVEVKTVALESEISALQVKYEDALTQLKQIYTVGREAEDQIRGLRAQLKEGEEQIRVHCEGQRAAEEKLHLTEQKRGAECTQLREQYEKEYKAQHAQNQHLQNMIDNVSRQHLELQDKYAQFMASKQQDPQSTRASQEATIRQKEAVIAQLKNQLADQQQLLSSQQSQLDEYMNSIEQLQNSCNSLRRQCESKLQGEESRTHQLEQTISKLRLEHEVELKQLQCELQQRIEAISMQHAFDVQHLHEQHERTCAAHKQQLNARDALAQQLADRERQLTELRQKLAQQSESDNVRIQELARKHEQRIHDVEHQWSQLRDTAENDAKSLRSQNQHLLQLTQTLQKKCTTLEQNQQQLEAERDGTIQKSQEMLSHLQDEYRRKEQDVLTSNKVNQHDTVLRLQIYEMKHNALRKLATKLVQSLDPKHQDEGSASLEELMEKAVRNVKRIRGKENTTVYRHENEITEASF